MPEERSKNKPAGSTAQRDNLPRCHQPSNTEEDVCGEGLLTSQAQIDANRRNAQQSTGPKDASRTKFNAVKHGLTAKDLVVMPLENPDEYNLLCEGLRRSFQSQSPIEKILIEQMASSIWRIRRIRRGERANIEEDLAEAPLEFELAENKRRLNESDRIYITRNEAMEMAEEIAREKAGEKAPRDLYREMEEYKELRRKWSYDDTDRASANPRIDSGDKRV